MIDKYYQRTKGKYFSMVRDWSDYLHVISSSSWTHSNYYSVLFGNYGKLCRRYRGNICQDFELKTNTYSILV